MARTILLPIPRCTASTNTSSGPTHTLLRTTNTILKAAITRLGLLTPMSIGLYVINDPLAVMWRLAGESKPQAGRVTPLTETALHRLILSQCEDLFVQDTFVTNEA